MITGTIVKIAGPLIVAENIENARLYDTVLVSQQKLLGEIIEIRGNLSSIQVYEDTSGIGLGEPVESLYRPLSIALGPGLLSSMLDGIGRNLQAYAKHTGFYLTKGLSIPTLDTDTLWNFIPLAQVGDYVKPNDRLGYVIEGAIKHYILVPHFVEGELVQLAKGEHKIHDVVAEIKGLNQTHEVTMVQYWPIRQSRPYLKKQLPTEPLITGQRIIDTFFPLAKGGTACVPGPFGSGKTVVQHQLAKWSNNDVVVYVGCGERGNEMTDVLNEFPTIVDPNTKMPLMHKTVLIANTSNMPVAAREASIYTGITIAEYFRDMGYHVSLMADSTSRWAEALREMSGRLQEMPGDEGYPAYLASRLAEVYERAGIVENLGKEATTGSVTMIGAVSPAGGDLSEPVTQATLRIVKVFWALDSSLAYARHFPAINWLTSYSLYQDVVEKYMKKRVHKNHARYRYDAMILLKDEKKLLEVAQLIGKDSLADEDVLKLEIARMLREDFLQQNAFHADDTYTSLPKQAWMLEIIMEFYKFAKEALVHDHVFLADILNMSCITKIARMKEKLQNQQDHDRLLDEIQQEFDRLKLGGERIERV